MRTRRSLFLGIVALGALSLPAQIPVRSANTILDVPPEMFSSDGYLYVSLGDGGDSSSAQEIDDKFYSALMRIDVDGKPRNLTPNAHPSSVGTY